MVRHTRPPLATTHARQMRREQTDAEQKLWLLLRSRRLAGAKFRRQIPIGSYIADFICPRRKLTVEADGGQHVNNPNDAERDRWLTKEGYVVIRYGNIDILTNPEGVLSDLLERLRERPRYFVAPPHPAAASFARRDHPLPQRGEGNAVPASHVLRCVTPPAPP
jgi:very-short-patch-repair endonuclease